MQFPRKQEISPATPAISTDETKREGATSSNVAAAILPGEIADESRLSIGRGVKITGKVEKCGVLEVSGVLEADVTADEIIIDQGGSVVGSLEARTLDNSGHLDGTAMVSEQLTVRSGGIVDGSLTYGSLCIETGGVVNGDLKAEDHKPDGAEKIVVAKRPGDGLLSEASAAAG